ncbi:zwei Ig domain protein zig-8 [Galendromus occidentalis]|uniref:Zwei Ig domain protein zig-8 n=1 Tax=Galendromus occidentalis TaxID=34638 RepID=A0AAJ7SDK2_9ACAR|nr:zwei Ig domain protein zig-8 [Galendromus occidentalis]
MRFASYAGEFSCGTARHTNRRHFTGREDMPANVANHLEAHNPPPEINSTLSSKNVTGQLGSTVYLHCYVHNIGQKTVTWLRPSDYHILTVGMMTYTTDDRFSAVRGDGVSDRDDWMLQIRAVQKTDQGTYECQVNTQHPMLSFDVHLNVLSPHASIEEGPELFVNSGSSISLTCVIHDCPQPLSHVFWYHGDRVVNYDRHSEVNISLVPLSDNNNNKKSVDVQLSRLVIHNANKQHSGTYTCAPVHSSPAIVQVHVLHAEEQLARKSHEVSAGTVGHPLFTLYTLGPLLALQMAFLLVVARTT